MIAVGPVSDPLRALLEDVVADLGLQLKLVSRWDLPPDLVVVVVEHQTHTAESFAHAQRDAQRAPILAILPLSDPWLERCAYAFGASACYALDTSLERLRGYLEALRRREQGPRARR